MNKREILSWFSGNLSTLSVEKILTVLCIALVLSAVIFFTYKYTYKGVSYNARFNCGNVIITLVTAVIMMMIGSNIAISLGMVGALSIVRFRTAIKDPQDTIYVFWSLVTGLCVGAHVYQLAVISSLFIAIVIIALSFYSSLNSKYIVIVRGSLTADKEAVERSLKDNFKSVRIRSVNNRESSVEMIFEVCASTKGFEISKVDALKDIDGIKSANYILEA